jgi:CRISPR/Cas system CMR subunit Cmr6 (Cas7 group RAMP superfamily)
LEKSWQEAKKKKEEEEEEEENTVEKKERKEKEKHLDKVLQKRGTRLRTALQNGRSRVPSPIVSLEFSTDVILTVALWLPGRLRS